MHMISFDASPRQVSKLRNGHAVRIKRGTGFNLVVHPSNYKLVSRAFTKDKGIQLKLSPEELETNQNLSPEQHSELGEEIDGNLFQHLPMAQGGSIFKKIKRALHSKGAKKLGRELQPLTREAKSIGREMAHEQIANTHQHMADRYGDDERSARLVNLGANMAHHKVGGSLGKQLRKAFHSKTAKHIGRELKPLSRALKSTARDLMHEKIAQMHMTGADAYGDDPRMAGLMNIGAQMGHQKVGYGLGAGLGAGLYAGRGMNAHDALKMANMASAHANYQLAKMHNATVHGQLTQPPIKRYYDDEFSPPSRGSGLHNHHNLIRGRGSMISQDHYTPQALLSQPYGANWHMQFQLPPQYHKYNDGTDMEGRGMYI